MSDTHFGDNGHEWPRRYTRTELDSIVKSLAIVNIDPFALEELLQDAVKSYQWANLEDEGVFPNATNKGRRERLNQILKLCSEGASREAIETALNELDGPTSQRLSDRLDIQRLARAAGRVLEEIPERGPNPKRARRQFIDDLVDIFELTGQRAGRRVLDEEYGPFRDFVMAALRPIDVWQQEFVALELERIPSERRDHVRNKLKRASVCQGCDADIKAVRQQRNKRSRKRKRLAQSTA